MNFAKFLRKPFFTEHLRWLHLISKKSYRENLTCHPNLSFFFEQEQNGKLSFLNIEVSRGKGKLVATVYRKSTFSRMYTHFESFLPTIWRTQFFETSILKKTGILCDLLIIYCCLKTFVDKLFMKRPQLITVAKKTLFLSLPYLGEISLQTRTKLRKSLKGLLNSCKLQIVFKS